jgi:phosphoserine phosphatase RsbU/P
MSAPATSVLAATALARSRGLAALADAWLADGATAFEVRLGRLCLWRRGASALGTTPTLTAQVRLGPIAKLELCVHGVSDRLAQGRLGAEAALLSESLRLEDELQRMTGELIDVQDQLLAVFDLARATRRHLSLDAVLTELVAEICRLTDAELAFTVVPDAEQGRLVCHPAPPDERRDVLRHVWKWTTSSGVPLVANAVADNPAELDIPSSVRNLVAVPVTVDGRPAAVLGVVNRRDTTFSAGTVKLLQALAEQAGGLMEAAVLHEQTIVRERLQREMELAAAIQAGLMAHAPLVVPGVELVAQFRPAAEVGGDFYDYRLRSDGQLALCVGDVSGKGLPAALVMSMTRAVLRGASQLLDEPAAVLERANADLYADLNRVDAFVTAFAGYYDRSAGRLVFASAGHSPVIYCPSGDRAGLLRATGLPLGVLLDPASTGDVVRMGPGDLLVVATDGFSEATNPAGELFGYDRLLALVESLAAAPAAEIAGRMFEAVTEFGAGRPQDDDQTLLIVKGC